MTVKEIQEKSKLSYDTSESLYNHSIWIRKASPKENVDWIRMLLDKRYREHKSK